jgi:hypothetical protein
MTSLSKKGPIFKKKGVVKLTHPETITGQRTRKAGLRRFLGGYGYTCDVSPALESLRHLLAVVVG